MKSFYKQKKGEDIIMRKITTTTKINEAISNNLLQITKAECSYKSFNRIDEISAEKFKESLDFLCEAEIFADFVDWHFERNLNKNDEYILDSGAMNPYSENIVTVYMRIGNGVKVEDIDKALLFVD